MKNKTLILTIVSILVGILVYQVKGSFPFIYTTIAALLILNEHNKK